MDPSTQLSSPSAQTLRVNATVQSSFSVEGRRNKILRPRIIFQPHVEAIDRRPRRMTVEDCQATAIVSHAMEYLSDSREISSGKIIELDQGHPDVFALLLLMEARYNIFAGCPVIERRKNTLGALFKGKERRRNSQPSGL